MQSPRAHAPCAEDADEDADFGARFGPPSPIPPPPAGSSSSCECAAAAHSPAAAAAANRARQAMGCGPAAGQAGAPALSAPSSGGNPGFAQGRSLSGFSPRQAALERHQSTIDDEVLAPSPRNDTTPRPSFVPPLQLTGLSTKAGAGAAAAGAPALATGYLAALSQGGLSASLSPRSPSPRASMSGQKAQMDEQEQTGTPSPNLLGPPKGFTPLKKGGAPEKGGKQMQQQEECAVPHPKSFMMQEEHEAAADESMSLGLPLQGLTPKQPMGGLGLPLGDAKKFAMQQEDAEPQSPRLSTRGGAQHGAGSPLRATKPPPLLALSPHSPGGADPFDEDFDASMVVATPRTPRLSARPGNTSATSSAASTASSAAPEDGALGGGQGVTMTPRGGGAAMFADLALQQEREAAESNLLARNVVLTPRGSSAAAGGGGAAAAADGDGSSPPPGVCPPPLDLGSAAFAGEPPRRSEQLTEMTRTSFTEDEVESFEVTVPDGAGPGAVLRLTLPSGELVEIPVPENAMAGDKLSFELSKSSLQAVEMALSGEQIVRAAALRSTSGLGCCPAAPHRWLRMLPCCLAASLLSPDVDGSMRVPAQIFPGKVCKGKKLKRPPTADGPSDRGHTYEVVVPAGWVSGLHTHFQAQLGDVVAAIPVPDGCEPKTVLHIEAPKGTSKVIATDCH